MFFLMKGVEAMRELTAMRMNRGVKILMPAVLLAIVLYSASPSFALCGPMDIALIVDDTGSMGVALTDIQSTLVQVINVGEYVSGGDLRIGLVTFSNPLTEGIYVNVPFTTNYSNVTAAVQGLVAANGGNEPQASAEALQYVVTGTTDPGCTNVYVTGAPMGSFRTNAVKIAVLVTDAHPDSCNNLFTPGVSDVHAHQVAIDCLNAGVKIVSVYVPDLDSGGEHADIKAIMEDYATTSGGVFVESQPDGSGTGDGIASAVATCGVPPTQSATRNAAFWFTHAYYLDPGSSNCVSLLNAILINGGIMNIGFLTLPTANYTASNVINADDALMEALSFYWKNLNVTGEDGGTQNAKDAGSMVCKARKQLAVQLIAATANVHLLQANPTNSFYGTGASQTNFPADLLQQARTALAGYDTGVMATQRVLLTLFNSSGVTNNFPSGLEECSPQKSSQLRSISRDPTTQDTCPGNNDSCAGATVVIFPNSSNPFASAIYSQSVNLNAYTNNMPSPTCGSGGPDAVWRILPSVGTSNRQFTVSTAGSNFSTMLSVWTGACGASSNTVSGGSNGLNQVTCAVNSIGLLGATLTFNTDGSNTFFIVVEGPAGQYGKLKLTITSP